MSNDDKDARIKELELEIKKLKLEIRKLELINSMKEQEIHYHYHYYNDKQIVEPLKPYYSDPLPKFDPIDRRVWMSIDNNKLDC